LASLSVRYFRHPGAGRDPGGAPEAWVPGSRPAPG
jgi:hypothetical protein